MRECLIKLYCTIGEIQSRKEGHETAMLKKELATVSQNMERLRGDNKKLRKELDFLKDKIGRIRKAEASTQTPNNNTERSPRKEEGKKSKDKRKNTPLAKRNSPEIIPVDRRSKERKIRRELSFPLGSGRKEQLKNMDAASIRSHGKRAISETTKKRSKKISDRSAILGVVEQPGAVVGGSETVELWLEGKSGWKEREKE